MLTRLRRLPSIVVGTRSAQHLQKYNQHALAMNIEHVVSIDRGLDYAVKINNPEVWSRLAKARLDGMKTKDAVGLCCCCRAAIYSHFNS